MFRGATSAKYRATFIETLTENKQLGARDRQLGHAQACLDFARGLRCCDSSHRGCGEPPLDDLTRPLPGSDAGGGAAVPSGIRAKEAVRGRSRRAVARRSPPCSRGGCTGDARRRPLAKLAKAARRSPNRRRLRRAGAADEPALGRAVASLPEERRAPAAPRRTPAARRQAVERRNSAGAATVAAAPHRAAARRPLPETGGTSTGGQGTGGGAQGTGGGAQEPPSRAI